MFCTLYHEVHFLESILIELIAMFQFFKSVEMEFNNQVVYSRQSAGWQLSDFAIAKKSIMSSILVAMQQAYLNLQVPPWNYISLRSQYLLVYSRRNPFFYQHANRSHLVLTNPVNNLRPYLFTIYFNITLPPTATSLNRTLYLKSFLSILGMHIQNNNTSPLTF